MSARKYGSVTRFELPSGYITRGGDDTALVTVDWGRLAVDEFGADVITRIFECRLDLYETFQPLPGDVDAIFPKLQYVTHSMVPKGNFKCRISVDFAGILGKPRYRRPDGELTIANVNLQDLLQNSVSIDYFAPKGTWKYATIGEPTGPKFEGQVPVFAKAYHIDSTRGATFLLPSISIATDDVSGNTFVRANGLIRAFVDVRQVQFDKKPYGYSNVWQVTESNEGRIKPANEGNPFANTGISLPQLQGA